MTGTGTTAPLERSNAAGAAGWAFVFVFAGWVLGLAALLLYYTANYEVSPPEQCGGILSCMTPRQNTTLVAMYTAPFAVGGWLVAALLVLLAQLSRGMRRWHPAALGAVMSFLVLAVAGVIVLKFLYDQYTRYR